MHVRFDPRAWHRSELSVPPSRRDNTSAFWLPPVRRSGRRCRTGSEMRISRQRGKYLKEQEFRRAERNFRAGAGSAADTKSPPARAGLSDVVNWHGELWNNELRQAPDR